MLSHYLQNRVGLQRLGNGDGGVRLAPRWTVRSRQGPVIEDSLHFGQACYCVRNGLYSSRIVCRLKFPVQLLKMLPCAYEAFRYIAVGVLNSSGNSSRNQWLSNQGLGFGHLQPLLHCCFIALLNFDRLLT